MRPAEHTAGGRSTSSDLTREPARAGALSGGLGTFESMSRRPSRIELLELDIDLRLADLWGEAAEVEDWSTDIVAAFLRAAYGKGYCDALTEDEPGSLCHDHGYRIPERPVSPAPKH